MTHDEAIDTGLAACQRFGKKFIVFRLPAWPPGVFSCQATGQLERGLPPEAETFEVLEPKSEAKKKPSGAQGSLF